MSDSRFGSLTVVEDLDVLEQDGAELRSRLEVNRAVDPSDLSLQGHQEGLPSGVGIDD
jgi:hypothetical protein